MEEKYQYVSRRHCEGMKLIQRPQNMGLCNAIGLSVSIQKAEVFCLRDNQLQNILVCLSFIHATSPTANSISLII
jgi:hypothetical protein